MAAKKGVSSGIHFPEETPFSVLWENHTESHFSPSFMQAARESKIYEKHQNRVSTFLLIPEGGVFQKYFFVFFSFSHVLALSDLDIALLISPKIKPKLIRFIGGDEDGAA